MEFALSNLYIVHWIRPYSTLCLAYAAKSVGRINNHFMLRLNDSIHYNALVSGNYETYKEYVKITNQEDHTLEKFLHIKNNWKLELCTPITIYYNIKTKKWHVNDGVHRLALLKYFGIIKDTLPFSLINFQISAPVKRTIGIALQATTKHTLYNGWNNNRCEYGYHSFIFGDMYFKGQRNNLMRISDIKKHIQFIDKSVLDFGCNTGGLLIHLPEIKKGRGYDYDEKCIIAANLINTYIRFHSDLLFQQANLETIDLTTVAKKGEFDIIFLCSLGSWIKNWKDVYTWAIRNIPCIIFEENNASEGASQLALFSDNGCKITKIIENSDDDNTGNRLRNTYKIDTMCLEKD